jgi:hypothetical protein
MGIHVLTIEARGRNLRSLVTAFARILTYAISCFGSLMLIRQVPRPVRESQRRLAASRAALIATLLLDSGNAEERKEIYRRQPGKRSWTLARCKICEKTFIPRDSGSFSNTPKPKAGSRDRNHSVIWPAPGSVDTRLS